VGRTFANGERADGRESSSSKRGREAFSKGDIVRRMEEDRERVCLLPSSLNLPIILPKPGDVAEVRSHGK
jgi:hypothetical protein